MATVKEASDSYQLRAVPTSAKSSKSKKAKVVATASRIDDQRQSSGSTSDTASLQKLQYILAMTHELKHMATNSGFIRVALILEMAELEAIDQTRCGRE